MGFVDVLPPSVRKVLYVIWGVLGLILGALAAAFAAVPDVSLPTWYLVAGAVWAFLGTALGFTAAANTNPPAATLEPIELPYGVLTNASEPYGAVPAPVYDADQRRAYGGGGAPLAGEPVAPKGDDEL